MAVKDWSPTAGSNTGILSGLTLDGAVMTPPQVDNAFREMAAQIASQLGKLGFKGADIASAGTTNLATATGWYLDITGTTTITAFGTVDAGQEFILRFTGALILTHNASSLILPGAANITTGVGDVARMMSLGSGSWRCLNYLTASGVLSAGPATISGDLTVSGGDINIAPEAGLSDVASTVTNAATELSGGTAFNGGCLRVYGSTHASQASDIEFFSAGLQKYLYDASASQHQFSNGQMYFADGARVFQNSTNAPGAGNNTGGMAFSQTALTFHANGNGAHSLGGTADGTIVQFTSGGTARGSVSIAGAVTSYNTSSDERLKELFQTLDAGAIIDAINVYRFAWREDGRVGYGVKAQECHEVFPDAITVGSGEPGDEDFMPWTADYSKYVPLLLAEIKALRARVAALEGWFTNSNSPLPHRSGREPPSVIPAARSTRRRDA